MNQIMRRTPGRRAALGMAAGLALALTLGACGSNSNPLDNNASSASSAGGASAGPIVVGSADFPESQTLAEVYAGALNGAGIQASTKPNIGARKIYLQALADGSIDAVPEYSGNLLLELDPQSKAVSPDDVLKALPAALPAGEGVLDASQAQDKDAMVVTQATAQKYQLKSLVDLGKVCDQLVLGANSEFRTREYGLPGLAKNYGCVPKDFREITDGGGPLTLAALLNDQIQVADIFTTTPSIADNSLVVLDDPKNNFIAQQVLPLVKKDKVSGKAADVLNSVSKVLTTDDLIDLNRAVSGDQKQNPKDAAADWLKKKGFVK